MPERDLHEALRAVAVIPARGGSKRFPRKNLINFLDRPIIAFTIEAALQSGCFDRLVVSTEDEEIAAIARKWGAEPFARAAELATDEARVVDVCLDVLDQEAAAGREYDILCCLYATAPLRAAADIRDTLALLEPSTCDFALAVTEFDKPPHQALKLLPGDVLEPMWPDMVSMRSDELPALRIDNGSTYATMVQPFRKLRTFYGPNLRGHQMPRDRSVDVDYPEDMELALWYAQRQRQTHDSIAHALIDR